MDERIEDLLPFYALGVLTDDERQQVEAYLATHPGAQAELLEAQEAVVELAYSALPVQPPAQLKNDLMKQVQADAPAQVSVSVPTSSFIDTLRRMWAGPYSPVMPLLAALSLLIAIVAGLWAYRLQNEISELHNVLATINQDLEQKMTPLQAQINPLTAENETIKQSISNQQQDIGDLDSKLATLQAENSALKEEIVTQREELASLNNRVSQIAIDGAALAEIITIEEQLATQNDLLTDLQNETISSLVAEIEQLKAANNALSRDLSSQRAAMAQLTTPNTQVMLITGTEALPNAHGHLVANPDQESALLVVAGLPELQPGLEYHFWLVQDGSPTRIGALDVDQEGVGLLIVAAEQQIGTYEGMGVSIEPAASSGEPANEMIMLGQFS